jgi:hypothetical protein
MTLIRSSITRLYGVLRAHPGWIEVKVKDRARSVPAGRLVVLYSGVLVPDSRLVVLYSGLVYIDLYSDSRLVVLYSDGRFSKGGTRARLIARVALGLGL